MSIAPAHLVEQKYWCRNCKREVVSVGIPTEWYLIRKCIGDNRELKTVSIVCSIRCLVFDAMGSVFGRLENNRY